MKMITDLRLECVRLAVTMVASKGIEATSVIKYANLLFDFVQDEQRPTDASPLAEKYKR